MRDKPTIWDTLTLSLWAIFFAVGLAPELVFQMLRELGQVSYFTAMVNSSFFISISLAAFISWFAYARCIESGMSTSAAVGKCIQMAILGMIAFMDLPSRRSSFESHTLLELVFQLQDMPGLYVKGVVVMVALSKLITWWYLYAMIFRYHAFGNRHVFANMPSVFPSARENAAPPVVETPVETPKPSRLSNPLEGPGRRN